MRITEGSLRGAGGAAGAFRVRACAPIGGAWPRRHLPALGKEEKGASKCPARLPVCSVAGLQSPPVYLNAPMTIFRVTAGSRGAGQQGKSIAFMRRYVIKAAVMSPLL